MANETRTQVIVPALPGWYVAVLRDDRFAFEPIIAWEIERCEWSDEPSADGRPGEQCVFHSVMPLTVGAANAEASEQLNFNRYANWDGRPPTALVRIFTMDGGLKPFDRSHRTTLLHRPPSVHLSDCCFSSLGCELSDEAVRWVADQGVGR
jgi:hypothetical protein